MSITLVCPGCGARWKIIPNNILTKDHYKVCPVCVSIVKKNDKK